MNSLKLAKAISLDAVVVAAQDQVSSNLGQETVILNLKNGVYYGLNEVGTCIWALVQEPATIRDIRDTLLKEYQVDPADCEQDLLELLEALVSAELIIVKNEAAS